jgi:glycosyltransferase involved in cell wall biosynthesis/tetratricopeptide (TPR) repeat protein
MKFLGSYRGTNRPDRTSGYATAGEGRCEARAANGAVRSSRGQALGDEPLDPEFYGHYYADLTTLAPAELREHWLRYGRAEGRFPSLTAWRTARALQGRTLPDGFIAEEYAAANPDVMDACRHDWQLECHYVDHGAAEGRAIRALDCQFFCDLYLDGARKPEALLRPGLAGKRGLFFNAAHMLRRHGIKQTWLWDHFDHHHYRYVAGRADLTTKAKAMRHFLEHGLTRRLPIAARYGFDAEFYAQTYLDSPCPYEEAIRHWLNQPAPELCHPNAECLREALGLAEPGFPQGFDAALYARANPDLGIAPERRWRLLSHYILHGAREERPGGPQGERACAIFAAIADSLAARGEHQVAAGFYEKALIGRRVPARTMQHYADCLLRLGQPCRAAQLYRCVLAAGDANAWTYLNLAASLRAAGAPGDAAEVLSEGVRRYPGDCAMRRERDGAIEAAFAAKRRTAFELALAGDADLCRRRLREACAWLKRFQDDAAAAAPKAGPVRRIAILASLDLVQCRRYRVEHKVEQLRIAGIDAAVFDYSRPDDLVRLEASAHGLDAAIAYRVPLVPGVARALSMLRQIGVPLFYEIDDLIFEEAQFPEPIACYRGQIGPETHAELIVGAVLIREAMALCDHAIASTPSLAAQMEPHVPSRRSFVHANALSNEHVAAMAMREKRIGNQNDIVTLFYGSGTKAHAEDFERLLAPALLRLFETHGEKLRLVLIGHVHCPEILARFADRITACEAIWDQTAYWSALGAADINLAVLKRTPFNDCKSEIKWLEAAMLGIPSVVSRTARHEEVIAEGVTGLMAETPEEWFDSLDALISDRALRERIGRAAKSAVLERYGLERMAENIGAILNAALMAARPSAQHPRRPKVLIVNVFYPPQAIGGATRVVHQNVQDLRARHGEALDIEVFCSIAGEPEPYRVRSWSHEGVRVTGVTTPVDPAIDRKPHDARMGEIFRAYLQETQPDLVHFHCVQRLTAAVVEETATLGIPYLVTVHDGWWISERQFLIDDALNVETYDLARPLETLRRFGAAAFERARVLAEALSGAARLLTVSHPFAAIYRKAGFTRIEVIENGLPDMPTPIRQPSADGRVRLGYLGGIHDAIKGYPLIQAAIAAAPFRHLSLTVVDHARAADERRSCVWNTTPVTFCGLMPQARMGELYGRLDVLLAPSVWPESYGLVTREALACGLWVIASDRGAMGACIIEGENGFVVDVSDAKGLAEALAMIDADPGRFRRPPSRRVTLRRACEQADALKSLYLSLVAERAERRPPGVGIAAGRAAAGVACRC